MHAAAQPSHDLAAQRPFDDFDVNAVGTLNMLEACRRHSPEAVFIHMSTNKVYGDGPNHIPAQRAGNALGLRRSALRAWHRRGFLDRPMPALALRRLEGSR